MKKNLINLSKKISQVMGLALTALTVSDTNAANTAPYSEELSSRNIDYVSNASARKTIPVLKLSVNNMTSGKLVSSHGSHRSHSSHSSHSSHRSRSFVY